MQRSSGERVAAASGYSTGTPAEAVSGSTGLLLRTLGRLELESAAISRPKPLLLLAYLALEGGGSREQLLELFFANSVDPRDALSTSLRRIGRVKGAIDVQGRLVTTRVVCDAADILDQLDNGALAAACAAYGGPFLAGVSQSLPAGGEEWIFSVREYLGKRILDAHLRLGDVALQDGDLAMARRHAATAYAMHEADVLEPEVIGRLYHLLRRTGHAQADSVMALVKDVVGVRAPEQLSDSPLPSLGPPRPGQLISREVELDAIISSIMTSEARMITLHGPGGVGKTRLAQELIRSPALDMTFGAARAFVPLEAVPTPELVPAAIAAQMGLDLSAASDPWAALARSIGARDQLLVLDGWEHLRDASASLLRLFSLCPGLTVVVTSRETLQGPVEWVISLTSLEAPKSADPVTIRATPAFRLFLQQARRHDLTFDLADDDLSAAARICRAVDGLPLALALAGAWTRSMPLIEIAETLERDPTSLAANDGDSGARHGSLRHVLESAWARLQPRDRAVLQRLSSFRGGFRRDAAAAVAGASMADLVRLLNLSWLTSRPDGRFEQHAVLRHYGQSRLDEAPQSSLAVHQAHNRHYLDPLMHATAGGGASTAPDLIPRLLEEEGNVLACLDRSVERRDGGALTVLAQALQWYFAVRGRFRDADAVFQRAIAQLPTDEPTLFEPLSLLLSGRAWCSRFVGDIDEAIALARRALRLADDSGSLVARYAALDTLGQGRMLVGDNRAATESLKAALVLARELADEHRACRVMEKLVYTHMAVGELTEATAISNEALGLVSSGVVKPSLDAVVTYMAAGFLAIARGDWLGAEAQMGAGLQLTAQIDHPGPATLLEAALGLGLVAGGLEEGDPAKVDRGAAHATKALEISRPRGEVLALGFASGTLARVAAHEGRFVDAQDLLRKGIEPAWAQGNRTAALWTLPWQVELYFLEGKEVAAAELAEALALEPATPAWIPGWLRELGVLRNEPGSVGASLDELVARLLRS